ncbi:MAG: ChaN family lipoprotein [Devosiaceae bacterium]|nr:ChaN family lipoprotein [Devosiaceae bacterium MH13]
MAVSGLAALSSTAAAQEGSDASCAFERVLDLRTDLPSSADALLAEASTTQLVFVGERHGTPEHVQLAACVLDAKAQGRPPVLALEHVPANFQSDLDAWRRNDQSDPLLFADIVGWESLGWPDYFVYQPLIEQVASVRAHIVATDQPRAGTRGGPSADALLEVAPRYGLQTDDIVELWIPEMIAAHCDLVDEATAQRMALAQMERDQIMAGRLIAGRGRGPSTLYFGGKGHVRMDVAIPYLIARTDRPPSMLTVAAFTEDEWAGLLSDGQTPAQLGLAAQYDIVVIAGQSAVTDAQECAAMREMMGLN